MKRYALQGVNDDQNECSVCGRVELKRVMWLVEVDDSGAEIDTPFHCGTSCGAKLLQMPQAKVKKVAETYASRVAKVKEQLWQQSEWCKNYYAELNASKGMNWKERVAAGVIDRCRANEVAFNEWFATQTILIPVE